MSLKVIIAVILLVLFVQCTEGFERVIVVNESWSTHNDFFIDDVGDILTSGASESASGNDSYIFENLCCIYGHCSCPSLHIALANLTSNVLINITTDVELSLIISLVNLANISITGHNNPIVNCNNSGGLHFMSCCNCTIEGITWEGCGVTRNISDNRKVNPVLHLYNSSNIAIQNCSFQHSVGPGVVLSEMTGDVDIKHCNFTSSRQYEDHGVAIHYSSNNVPVHSPLKLMIISCNFLYNQGAKSIVYFSRWESSAKLYEYLSLHNSKFHFNKGVPIYLFNQDLRINGNIEFYRNFAENGGGIFISDHSNVIFHKNATVNFTCNSASNNGGAIFLANHGSILFTDHPTLYQYPGSKLYDTLGINKLLIRVIFCNNTANGSGQHIYASNSNITVGNTAKVTFNGKCLSSFANSGGVYIENYSTATFKGNSNVRFDNNVASSNGGALYINDHSIVTFEENSKVIFSNNGGKMYDGGAMYIDYYSAVRFEGDTMVTFKINFASRNGGAICVSYSSTVTFAGYSTVTFTKNDVQSYGMHGGGAMFVDLFSGVIFEGNSTVTFNDNSAFANGGAMYIDYLAYILFIENSTVTFNDNVADRYSNNNWATVAFDDIPPNSHGGAMYINGSFITIFGGNSTVTFNNNRASGNGGAMYIIDYFSAVTFKENSNVTFNDNNAYIGGALYTDSSPVTFGGYAMVTFNNNYAIVDGGAIYITHSFPLTVEGNSILKFHGNIALISGGAVYTDYCTIKIEGKSTITFNDSKAYGNGGALYIVDSPTMTVEGNSVVNFESSMASSDGGAMYIDTSVIKFEGNSKVTFAHNRVDSNGGAIYNSVDSTIACTNNSTVRFYFNYAFNGGAVCIYKSSTVIFEGHCTAMFYSNEVDSNGGAIYADYISKIKFEDNSGVSFNNNGANDNGGALAVDRNSTVNFEGNCAVTFHHNMASDNGGAFYIDHNSATKFKEASTVTFNNNTADLGGSTFTESSLITFEGNSTVEFINNTALQDGGAIYFSDHSNLIHYNNSIVSFYYNTASNYGGTLYALLKESSINFNNSDIRFEENSAGTIQKSVYINVPKSCNSDCLFHGVNMNSQTYFPLATSPSKLTLYNAVKYFYDNDTAYETYYINNIMLGQEITLDACVLDYYDQQTEVTQFSITGMDHQDFNISGSKYISISCNQTTQGISVTGNLHSKSSYNYSIIISSYVTRISVSKKISVKLTVELQQCHPGFWYSSKSQKCECYNTKNIISCFGSNSTIKRDYWFGNVNGKSTVTSCPNNYCNFTCCETVNGIYHLSPVREKQCRPHRSGPACGSCEKGYTLSFDSPECINVNKCTIAGTVLVTALSLSYWIVIIVTVFSLMYFKITTGSLYAIIYYYSVVDILLGQTVFISNGLSTTVNIMSSLAKLTPQFLGQLCLVRNMSGIDQQFIHYIHPAIVLFVLIMISVLARRSHKVSLFISRAIIHFICFLLLLSYTSTATTSLLLMRPLQFVDVDKVYTYLSPDIEYFHGRHLAYIIVAVILTIIIVIGFPLLLLLEPFLNSKINFVKIKPLLDQFQCCYKDKYRCFAGYYMVCRLVIILLVIVRIFNEFTTQYLLISSCALMELLHVLVRPYTSTIHNVFDGIILQLIVIVSVLPMVELVDDYDETLVLVTAYFLVIFPLTCFATIKLWINRNKIQKNCKRWIKRFSHKHNETPTDEAQGPVEMKEFDVVVDDNMRRNAIVVDVNHQSQEHLPVIIWCREPFMEELNEIEALNDNKN